MAKHLFQLGDKNVAKNPDIREKISAAKMGHIVTQETRLKISASKVGKTLSSQHRLKIEQGLKSYFLNIEAREKASVGQKGRYKKQSEREKASSIFKEIWNDSEHRLKMSDMCRQRWKDPQFRDKISKAISKSVKQLWLDPIYVQHQLSALHRKPSQPERHLINILGKFLPEFKYNGDYSLGIMLAGLIPDFVNVDGKKEIIEVFGDYWHNKEKLSWHQTELGRIMAYNVIGYNCLVIWEHEIKTLEEEELLCKIGAFFRRGQLCKRKH